MKNVRRQVGGGSYGAQAARYKTDGRVLSDTAIPDDPALVAADVTEPAPDRPTPDPHGDALCPPSKRRNWPKSFSERYSADRRTTAGADKSERRAAFIREHPELVAPQNAEAVHGYWRRGVRLGLDPDGAAKGWPSLGCYGH